MPAKASQQHNAFQNLPHRSVGTDSAVAFLEKAKSHAIEFRRQVHEMTEHERVFCGVFLDDVEFLDIAGKEMRISRLLLGRPVADKQIQNRLLKLSA